MLSQFPRHATLYHVTYVADWIDSQKFPSSHSLVGVIWKIMHSRISHNPGQDMNLSSFITTGLLLLNCSIACPRCMWDVPLFNVKEVAVFFACNVTDKYAHLL